MLSWVQDGLSDLERSTVDELLYMAVEDVSNLDAVLSLPWVQDGISEAEYEALDKLGYLDTPQPGKPVRCSLQSLGCRTTFPRSSTTS